MISTRFARFFIFLASGAVTLFGQQSEKEEATLTVHLTTTRGLKMSPGTVSITSSQGRLVYASKVDGTFLVHLPYGTYDMEFRGDWVRPVRRNVIIDRPDCFVELAAVLVAPEAKDDPSSISIKIDPAVSCAASGFLWAKLVAVYAPTVIERKIMLAGTVGYALFDAIDDGTYVIIVVDGTKIRAALPVLTNRRLTTVTVPLSPCE